MPHKTAHHHGHIIREPNVAPASVRASVITIYTYDWRSPMQWDFRVAHGRGCGNSRFRGSFLGEIEDFGIKPGRIIHQVIIQILEILIEEGTHAGVHRQSGSGQDPI